MKLHITHNTRYTFSSPVSLFPHVFRFKPRSSRVQDIRSFSLEISPGPAGFVENSDAAGNDVQFAWFDTQASEFHITARIAADTFPDNPLDFIIFPFESTRFPVIYRGDDDVALIPYLNPITSSQAVCDFADEVSRDSDHTLVPFVLLLMQRIHERFSHVIRETGVPMEPEQTLQMGCGSCRDQVVMALAVLRYKGIAARFVSGYQYMDDSALHDLHAWVEVYFPGGGWRGFDPTTGLGTDERYVRVSAGAAPVNTLPVTGSFRGAAESSLEADIRIRKV